MATGSDRKFFDYDNDGKLDLFLANGHPDDMIEQYSGQVKYAEPLLLFRHDGNRLRSEVLRLRQRRQARPLPGQRPPRRHDRAVFRPGEIRRAAVAVSPRWQPAQIGSSSITTTTASSTSSWPTATPTT